MIKIAALIVSASLALCPFAASAAGPDRSSQVAEGSGTGKTPRDDEKVCKNGKPTGTRMVTRICKTRGEWKEIYARSQSSLDYSMRRSQVETGREDFQKGF